MKCIIIIVTCDFCKRKYKTANSCSSLRSNSASNSYTVMDSSSSTQVGSTYPFSFFDLFLFSYVFCFSFTSLFCRLFSLIGSIVKSNRYFRYMWVWLSVLTKAPNRWFVILLISCLSCYIDSGLRFISWRVFHLLIFWMGRKKKNPFFIIFYVIIVVIFLSGSYVILSLWCVFATVLLNLFVTKSVC